MASSLDFHEVLTSITQGLVDELDAAFARIWLLGPGDLCAECYKADSCTNHDHCLHLEASAGMYTSLNGEYRRIPMGAFKIGLIAKNREPVVTNDALGDERLPNKSWLKENELHSVAGYPLVFRDELLGVIAMFSRRVMAPEEFERLAIFANQAAVAIKSAQLFETLEQLRQKNELILKSAGEGIYGLDQNGNTTFVNPAAAQMLGWQADSLLDKPQHAVIHHTRPDGAPYPREECPIYAAFKDGRVHTVNDELFWRKDGTSFPVEYTSTPIRDDENNLVGAVVIFRDITERKKAEKELRESRARFSGILDIAREAIISTDESQHVIIFNKGAEKIFDYSQDEVLGKSIELLIPEKFHEVHSSHIAEFVSSDLTNHLIGQRKEIFGRRKNGETFPAEASISKLQLDGQLVLTVILRDISRRKQAEKALRDAFSEIEQLKDRLQAENVYLQEEIKLEHNFDEIISASESLKKILRNVEQVAATDATVLILGETGTGKELIARALHTISSRGKRPLVKVNCAALPANLIESELFGHEKGAFTGALSRKQGRFELADSGTIFLDEIGDLPLELQAKLLRVLQEGEFERVGGMQTIKVDVRVIAATNRDLESTVQSGEFREDLYYRLNVFPITLPPLRERREDIPVLVNHFVKKCGARLGKKIATVPQKVMRALQVYHFPGNVRELENIIERAIILAQDQTLLIDESLELLKTPAASTESAHTLEEMERNHIVAVLKETSWRIEGPKGAAQRLGINPNTLRSRMQKLGIKRPPK
ncbi:MAG: sigma 54-interacting transcriptional regulator [bacterium]